MYTIYVYVVIGELLISSMNIPYYYKSFVECESIAFTASNNWAKIDIANDKYVMETECVESKLKPIPSEDDVNSIFDGIPDLFNN